MTVKQDNIQAFRLLTTEIRNQRNIIRDAHVRLEIATDALSHLSIEVIVHPEG